MRRLLICFSWFATLGAAATVSGTVQIHGTRKSSYGDLVVWLESQGGATPPASGDTPHRTLLQKDKTFRPHILAVRSGTVVDFPNADPIFHNAFSNYDGQLFDVSLYPPGTTRSVLFKQPGIVRVFCNIHPMMSAVIVVLATPYFTRVGSDGRYELRSVPAGAYDLRFFDERATGGKKEGTSVKVETDSESVTLPAIEISESGYVPAPHKNKYGQDYPAADTYSDIPK